MVFFVEGKNAMYFGCLGLKISSDSRPSPNVSLTLEDTYTYRANNITGEFFNDTRDFGNCDGRLYPFFSKSGAQVSMEDGNGATEQASLHRIGTAASEPMPFHPFRMDTRLI